MSCYLAGELVIDGAIIQDANNGTLDITVCGASLTATQLAACSASCNGGAPVTCSDGVKDFTGTCNRVCSSSCGAKVNIMGCSWLPCA